MAFDAHANFAVSLVATAPSPASSGTSLVVTAGQGSRFSGTFNAVVGPANTLLTPTNAEIVRVTGIASDTFTITRTQEGSSARTILVGDQIYSGPTAKTFTDLEVADAAIATPSLRSVGRGATQALAGTNADGMWLPRYYGYKSWNTPLHQALGSSVTVSTVAGILVVWRVPWFRTDTITNALFALAAAGISPTNGYAAIFDSTGTQIAVSGDVSSKFTQTAPSISVCPMSPATSVTGGEDTYIYVGLMFRGGWGTFPTLYRLGFTASSAENLGLTATTLIQAKSTGTGLTTMPGSLTPSALASVGLSGLFWAGVS